MKLSVSVPDGLWASSRERRPDLNPSALVQAALEGWLQHRAEPSYAFERDARAEKNFESARNRLAKQARAEYERGYRAALEVAQSLDMAMIEWLARDRFDVVAWADQIGTAAVHADLGHLPKDTGGRPEELSALLPVLGGLVPSLGDDMPGPSSSFIRGFAAALRELWEHVVEGSAHRGGGRDG